MLSPAWFASTVHVPARKRVRVLPCAPDVAHTAGVELEKVTGSPELAEADSVSGPSP